MKMKIAKPKQIEDKNFESPKIPSNLPIKGDNMFRITLLP